MKTIKICKSLEEIINDQISGEIYSVYSKAINLITSDNLFFTLLSNEKPLSPNSIQLNEKIDFLYLEINKENKFFISNKNLTINDLTIDLNSAKLIDLKPNFKYKKDKVNNIIEKLKTIEKYIYKYGKHDGIAPIIFNLNNNKLNLYSDFKMDLNQYTIFIFNRLLNFLEVIANYRLNDINESVRKVIGFGPGLTPSVDDFISGIMISLIYLADYFNLNFEKILSLNKKILNASKNRTTRISEEMLIKSSYGETSENIRDFLIAILSCNKFNILERFNKVINFGDTSGTDTLCGIYIGFRIFINDENRRFFENAS